MSERTADRSPDSIVGTDRSPGKIIAAMAARTSVLVTGSLGSGKSHLLRAVGQELERRGLEPVLLRANPRLSAVPHGALDDCPDRRSSLLRDDDGTPLDRPVAVVVDDAQALDPQTAETLARAIYRRRAVAVLGIEVPRARSSTLRESSTAATTFVDLWLHGLAERVDLRELNPDDAGRLLDIFCGPDRFDLVTRARIIGLADGSRILLRELAAQASNAVAAGTDPLDALRGIQRHSRLGDALHAHVAELGQPERFAIALLGRLQGIAYADATRFLTPSVVDGLIASRLVQDDRSVRRRLYANAALAGESEHQLSAGTLDDAIDRAGARMLEAGGAWWSRPLAVAIAERWHRDGIGQSPAEAPPALRVRVARDAARSANDTGDPMLAIAYATLVVDGVSDDPALALEREHAQGTVSRSDHAHAAVDPASLDGGTLRRYLRLREHVAADIPATRILESTGSTYSGDDPTVAELELAAAECAAMTLDWIEAGRLARRAEGHPGASASTRLRATLISVLSSVHDGDFGAASTLLDRAAGLIQAPTGPLAPTMADRLLALCIELFAAQSAGRDAPRARERLRDETILASREERGDAIVLASLAAALVHARAGDADAAIAEIQAAAHRSVNLTLGPFVPYFQLSVARSLSLLGHVEQARRLQRRAADSIAWTSPLFTHSLALTESCVLAAEGAVDDAIAAAVDAAELSNRPGARLLHLRDLYQLAALGAADDVVLHKMRRIADATDLPAAHALAERAASVQRGRKSMTKRTPIERLRLGAPWSTTGVTDVPGATPPDPFHRVGLFAMRQPAGADAHRGATLGLTRREREVAHLVAEGLSNRDIAERLYLSVRTVESHVYQARAKIGARSRQELGRMIGPRPDGRGDGTNGAR